MSEITMIRTDCESEFDRVYRDAQFFAELYEQNREMERFVNESLIKASGNKQAINEMYILNESAFTDKIKAFFTKIKNFFKKIFDKLGASMNALFGEQKKFMEQYANIIMNCKYNGGDISDVKDHFKGLPRILDAADNTEQAVIGTNMEKYFNQNVVGNNDSNEGSFLNLNVFDSAKSITDATIPKKLDVNEEIKVTAFNEFIKQGYWSNKSADGFTTKNDNNNTPDIDGTFRAYFDGSDDTVTWSGDEVDKNFQVIINATYGGISYMNKLEKLMNTITKKMDEAEKKMDDYVKSQQDKIKKAVAQQGPKDDTNKDTGTSVTDEQIKSAINGKKYDSSGNATVNVGGKSYQITGGTDGQDIDVNAVKSAIGADGVKTESFSFINEMQFDNNSSSNTNSAQSNAETKMKSGASGADNSQKVSDANTAASNMSANTQQAANVKNIDKTDSNIQNKADQLLDADIHNRQGRVNADLQISSSIVRTMFNAFQLTNKDFFSIIKHHVQWYLGNPGQEKESANKVSRKMDRNMNASGTQMKNPGNSQPVQNPQ